MDHVTIDPDSGRAAVETAGGSLFRLEADEDQPIPADGLSFNMYFAGGSTPLLVEDLEEPYPYPILHARLKKMSAKTSAFFHALYCIDKTLGNKTRMECIEEIDTMFDDPEIREHVIRKMQEELPKARNTTFVGVPSEGLAGEMFKDIRKLWGNTD